MITYRIDKGSPLSIEELDENFRTLEEKIENIDEKLEPLSLSAEQVLDTIIIKNNGVEIGNFTIPKPKISFKKDWQENNFYEVDDWIIHLGNLYICNSQHTSGQIFLDNNWIKVFEGKI